jgi:hypothetical protein
MAENEVKDDRGLTDSLKDLGGMFINSLLRNNAKIRDDRAYAIYESAEMVYKRKVEDMTLQRKQLIRERDALLDLSPTNSQSLVMKANFDEYAFVEEDLAIGKQIRNLDILLEIANERYNTLFK